MLVTLKFLRTGVVGACLHKRGLSPNKTDCGAEAQAADYIINSCPLYRLPNEMNGLLDLDETITKW